MTVLSQIPENYIGPSKHDLEAAHGLQMSEHHARANLHAEPILRATRMQSSLCLVTLQSMRHFESTDTI